MTENDDFDKIVEGLELDLEFPEHIPAPEPADPTPTSSDDTAPVEQQVPFYRQVEPVPLRPRRRGVAVAWTALAGAPLLLVVATMIGEILPRPMLAGAVLIFVAAAIYLVSQLPEHGPSRPDWPDDGAVL